MGDRNGPEHAFSKYLLSSYINTGKPWNIYKEFCIAILNNASLGMLIGSIGAFVIYFCIKRYIEPWFSSLIESVSKTVNEYYDFPDFDNVVKLLPKRPKSCLLYTSPSPRDLSTSRMPSSA